MKNQQPETYTSPRCEVIAIEMQGVIAGSPKTKAKEIPDNDF